MKLRKFLTNTIRECLNEQSSLGDIELNDNFWKWFGNSEVIGEDRSPIICYHGTDKEFNVFKPSKYLVHNIYAINKKIEDAKQDFNHHDKISDKIWNSIIKNSKTSDTVTLINVANTHKDLSNAAVSKIKRLHLDKDEAIKQELDNNKYL
jgi:hypothetical protein